MTRLNNKVSASFIAFIYYSILYPSVCTEWPSFSVRNEDLVDGGVVARESFPTDALHIKFVYVAKQNITGLDEDAFSGMSNLL